jgi:hypothetical protein
MADGILLRRSVLRPAALPTVSFGPFQLLEAMPWLMFASAMRFVAYTNPILAVPAIALASYAILLAFLLAARRMIEIADGTTQLGKLAFADQLRLARRILGRIVLLLIGAATLAAFFVPKLAIYLFAGFDGIAFDQFSRIGIAWSVILATIVLLMVVRAGDAGEVTLIDAVRELWSRWLCLVPAIILLTLLLIALSAIQGEARGLVVLVFRSDIPMQIKNLVYFFFVFSFAALRLWMTLAVLVFALRESYRDAAA